MMSEYHVGCGAFAIYAGTLDKNKNLWENKTACTDEAIEAVRDYMIHTLLCRLDSENNTACYGWRLKDGRFAELRITIKGDKENG